LSTTESREGLGTFGDSYLVGADDQEKKRNNKQSEHEKSAQEDNN
jgi:hypothetical protein